MSEDTRMASDDQFDNVSGGSRHHHGHPIPVDPPGGRPPQPPTHPSGPVLDPIPPRTHPG